MKRKLPESHRVLHPQEALWNPGADELPAVDDPDLRQDAALGDGERTKEMSRLVGGLQRRREQRECQSCE